MAIKLKIGKQINDIDVNTIEAITILKRKDAIKHYTEDSKYESVILIETKQIKSK